MSENLRVTFIPGQSVIECKDSLCLTHTQKRKKALYFSLPFDRKIKNKIKLQHSKRLFIWVQYVHGSLRSIDTFHILVVWFYSMLTFMVILCQIKIFIFAYWMYFYNLLYSPDFFLILQFCCFSWKSSVRFLAWKYLFLIGANFFAFQKDKFYCDYCNICAFQPFLQF